MECSEVQKRLSAYLEGSLPREEKTSLEEHLAPCQQCRRSLAELKRTLEHLQGLPEVEPPPWLAQKVMARVRSEAEDKRGVWEFLFHPIHIKLPLEAAAVIAIAVTTIYLFRAMQPAMRLSKEPLEEIRPPATSEVAKPPHPSESKAPSMISGSARTPAALPKVKRQKPMSERRGVKDAYDEALSAHRQIKDKTAPPQAELEVSKAEPEPAPVPSAAPPEEGRRAKAPPPPAGTIAPQTQAPLAERAVKKGTVFNLILSVKDMEAATIQIEKGIADLGGNILRQERQETKTTVVAELSPDQLQILMNQLKPLGEIKGDLAPPEGKEGALEMVRIEILRSE